MLEVLSIESSFFYEQTNGSGPGNWGEGISLPTTDVQKFTISREYHLIGVSPSVTAYIISSQPVPINFISP